MSLFGRRWHRRGRWVPRWRLHTWILALHGLCLSRVVIELLSNVLWMHLLLWVAAIVLLLMAVVLGLLVALGLHCPVVVSLSVWYLTVLMVRVLTLSLIVCLSLSVLLLMGHHHHSFVLSVVDGCCWHVGRHWLFLLAEAAWSFVGLIIHSAWVLGFLLILLSLHDLSDLGCVLFLSLNLAEGEHSF